jgi:hypothetical protein
MSYTGRDCVIKIAENGEISGQFLEFKQGVIVHESNEEFKNLGSAEKAKSFFLADLSYFIDESWMSIFDD